MTRLKMACTTLLVLLCGTAAIGQLNAYRYVVVPKHFEAFKEENQYLSSTLVKYHLTEAGFTAYYEGDVPEDISGFCEGLKVGLLDESGMFSTNIKLIFTDCRGKEVFRTAEGSSREKELKDGYKEAIEEAFQSVSRLNYHYEPKPDTQDPVVLNFDGDVKGNPTDADIVQEASAEEQQYQAVPPQHSDVQKADTPINPVVPGLVAAETREQLFAQPIPNGFQLVDRTPAIRLRLFNSSRPDVFIAENDEVHGVLYKLKDSWYFEYYKNDKKVVRELDIRF